MRKLLNNSSTQGAHMEYSFLDQLAGLLILGFLVFISYKNFNANPDQYSSKNINKSLTTMGLLALGLMGFVFILTQMVGSGDTYANSMKSELSSDYDDKDDFSVTKQKDSRHHHDDLSI